MKNFEKFQAEAIERLDMVKGGGEPIPGAEITLEQEPDDEPMCATGSKGGFAVGGFSPA